jgi:hypothetical protein
LKIEEKSMASKEMGIQGSHKWLALREES